MNATEILNLANISIAGLAGAVGSIFVSYLIEKSKNLATSQDIEKITNKIESVKDTIALKSEHLVSMRAAEREALIEYFKALNLYLDKVFDFDVLSYASQLGPETSNIRDLFQPFKDKLSSSKALLNLYYRTDVLKEQHFKVVSTIGEMVSKSVISVNSILKQYAELRRAEVLEQPLELIESEILNSYQQFNKEQVVSFSIVNLAIGIIRDEIKNRLQELSKISD